MKTFKKSLIIILAFSFVCLALTGCGPLNGKTETATASQSEKSAPADESSAATITLNGSSASISGSGATYENGNIIIGSGGTYSISGELTDGKITVDAGDENVTLVLDGVKITSADSSAINIVKAGAVTLDIKDGTENELADAAKYDFGNGYSDESQEEPNACVFSKSDLTVTGTGKLSVTGNYSNGIKSKDLLTLESANISVNCVNNALTGNDGVVVNGGVIDITAKGDGIHSNGSIEIDSGTLTIKADDDGIHADNSVTVNGGVIDIDCHEGIEGTTVTVNDGTITISASDDGINAAQKTDGVTPSVEINGGEITITMGAGDTDAIDSNGNIVINGGKITITGQSGFDYEGKAELNGGEVYLNGQQITEITNQFAGGMGGFGNMPGGGGNFGGRGERGGFPGGVPGEGFDPGAATAPEQESTVA